MGWDGTQLGGAAPTFLLPVVPWGILDLSPGWAVGLIPISPSQVNPGRHQQVSSRRSHWGFPCGQGWRLQSSGSG